MHEQDRNLIPTILSILSIHVHVSSRIGTISIVPRSLSKTGEGNFRRTIPTDNNSQYFSRPRSLFSRAARQDHSQPLE